MNLLLTNIQENKELENKIFKQNIIKLQNRVQELFIKSTKLLNNNYSNYDNNKLHYLCLCISINEEWP